MKLAIIGAGYVGLVSGVCLAARGHDVTCVDINPLIVDRLNRGEPTIHERGLPELLSDVVKAGRFRATTDLPAALDGSEVVMIAVGTPSEEGRIDLQYIRSAASGIGAYIGKSRSHISVVVKSTVVPGTTDTVVRREIEAASGLKHPAFGLGMNPEFLREGEAIEDFMNPDRIVFGNEDPQTLARLENIYSSWKIDKLSCNTRTAEMVKYANNCLLATQISAVNELANLAASIGGIDIKNVMQGVHLDKRWNPTVDGKRTEPPILSYLIPGCGFGGSCFPKDVQALRSQGEERLLQMDVLNAVLKVNADQPGQVARIIQDTAGSIKSKNILVLGLAFKPNTDDVRESASLRIVADMVQRGAVVKAHDPIATDNFKKALNDAGGHVEFVQDWEQAVGTADIVVIATNWPEYRELANKQLRGKIIFDSRRLLSAQECRDATYLTIGLRPRDGEVT